MHKSYTKYRSGFTLVEMILVVGMMAVISLAMVGMVRSTHQNWETLSNRSSLLLDGQAVIQQMTRILRQAKAVTAVTESTDDAGFITFTGVNDTTEEFRLNISTGELSYGDPNALDVLVAPVSKLLFTCYDYQMQLLAEPVDAAEIRTVAFEATFVDPDDSALTVALTGRVFIQTSAVVADPSGGVLFVAADAASLTAQETARKVLIESWGYAVSLISDDASQAVFDTAAADADVAYVSEQVSDLALGTKLTGATIGVVNEEGNLIDDFKMASGSPTPVTLMMASIVDNTHYITSPFNLEDITLSNSGPPFTYFTSGVAAGVEVLGQVFSKSSLMVADAGDELLGGTPAAGRRVKLPWGSSGFDINALTADGQTILRRSLEWAAAEDTTPTVLLLVVDDAASLTAQEALRKILIESWDYTVSPISDHALQTDFDTALAGADVVYNCGSGSSASVGTKLTAATVGVLNEDIGLCDELGMAETVGIKKDSKGISILDNTHYVTSGFSLGPLTLYSIVEDIWTLNGALAPGLQVLAEAQEGVSSFPPGLAVLETGAELYGGGFAAGRRLQVPWSEGSFDINALNADGQTVMQRAIEWAADGAGGGSEPEPDPEMYVHDITMAWRKQGPRYYGQATVWIKDDSGTNVEGATVEGTWSGSVSGTDSGDTAADGTVMEESSGVNGGGTYIFTVTGVSKTGFTYNASLNVESSGMIIAP